MKKKTIEEAAVVAGLSALAQTLRLRVFRTLVMAGPDGLTPGVIAQQLDIAPSALSFHLKELTHAGLVGSEPLGRHLIYRANFAQMDALLGYLTEHCCQGASCDAVPQGGKALCKPR